MYLNMMEKKKITSFSPLDDDDYTKIKSWAKQEAGKTFQLVRVEVTKKNGEIRRDFIFAKKRHGKK